MASYERRNKKTPSGGDYSEIYYLDDDWQPVDSSEATLCMIRECKANGTLDCETLGFCKGHFDTPRFSKHHGI